MNFDEPRLGEVAHSHAAIDAAAEWLDWRPQVSLEEGLRSMFESAGTAAS